MRNFTALLLLAVTTIGCGTSAGPPPEAVFPVSGVVKFKGKPVVGADIVFSNTEKKRSAFGRTNDKGEYRLTTFSSNDGAVEGMSAVTIAVYAAAAAEVAEADVDSEAYVPPDVDVRPTKPKKTDGSEIPDRYSSASTSGLVAMVASDRENVLNFELEP